MGNCKTGLYLAAVLLLGACASPAIDTSAVNFNEDKYTDDLHTCRGGSAMDAILGGLGGAFSDAPGDYRVPVPILVGFRFGCNGLPSHYLLTAGIFIFIVLKTH